MDIYIFSIWVLICLAVCDLIVGVVNDAVNFLNSSIGSRVAPRHIIMIIASLGMLAGVTFSSGMMEVARKGIFHPKYFVMPELMTIFLAVMLTDIILLDLDLPGIRGEDVLPRILEHTDVPVLCISGHAVPERIDTVMKRGAKDFIAKPFQMDRLLAAINQNIRPRDHWQRSTMQ